MAKLGITPSDRQMNASPKPAPKPTQVSRVAEAMRAAILTGDLAPGAKVNLEELRERLDVSLSPMREAMARLVAEGLVSFEDQRGYRITPVTRENLDEVTTLRADLEAAALGHAVARAGLDWESEVLSALHRLERAGGDPAPAKGEGNWQAAHAAFHKALVGGCRMPLLTGFCAVLYNLADRYQRLLRPAGPDGGAGTGEHRQIAQAAVARDGPRAMALMRAHIERAGAELATRLPPDID